MNTPISWIKAYVPDLDCTVQEYVDKMTLSGSHVENAVYLDKNLEKIVVGRIEKIEKHPDADKLVICQVNVGDEEVQIVTGASNVFKGAMVPVVLDGGRVAGGHDGSPNPENGIKIKKGKLRGVPSYGMMCSIEELGSTRDMYPESPEDGIYIFDESRGVKPGDDAVAALGLRDAVVEFEITSNRVDCFSMIGMAREAAATFEKPFYAPEVKVVGNDERTKDYISVEVEDTELCPRYTARIVKNIKLAPSPEWMQRRLAAMGIRPINNIVDITNYVMEEYGQPMHAYDLDKIRGHKIVVKRANDGDVYTTLDGQERKLDKDVLMINDAEGPVGIAGIMGGENSMVTDDIQTMLFEAATFDGTNIRLSSKRIGLRTDASGKFEKGLDPENALEAINRACQLVEELGAGEVVGGVVDVYPNPVEDVKIPFEPEKYNKLLGTNVSEEKMMEYFDRLEIGYDKETNMLLIPSFRQDLRCSADIAEEVARFFGYDNIPTTLPHGEATAGKKSFSARVEDVVMNIAEQNGFCGGMTYSFESPKVFDKLLLPEFDKQIQEYTLDSDTKEDNVTIKAIADDERANITGTGNIKLQTGENNLRVDVSAENGTVRTYLIKVTRKIQDETLRLSSIKLNAVDQNGNKDEVDLSPSFSENIFSYTAKIYNGASKIDVDTSCLNENAKITVEGNENLKDGKNTIIITVSKEGKTETVSYKIDVIRESSRETSNIPTDKKDNKTAICVIMLLAVIVIFMLLTRKKNGKH